MGGVDLMDQRVATYCWDRKSTYRYYLQLFFDLMDMACVNSFAVYNLLKPNDLSFFSFKIVVAKGLIGIYCGRQFQDVYILFNARCSMWSSTLCLERQKLLL